MGQYNSLMRQVNQVDARFKQLFLDASGFTVDEMKETVAQIHVVVDQSLEKIQAYLTVDDPSSGAMGSEALQELRASVARTGTANAGES